MTPTTHLTWSHKQMTPTKHIYYTPSPSSPDKSLHPQASLDPNTQALMNISTLRVYITPQTIAVWMGQYTSNPIPINFPTHITPQSPHPTILTYIQDNLLLYLL